jgi:glycerol-1-phosphate dehydrogenase [NAD(P)+]
MTPNGSSSRDVFGRTISCTCGKTHRILPDEVIYTTDAFDRLPEVCARHADVRHAAVVFDRRTRQAAGDEVVRALRRAEWRVEEIELADPGEGRSPVCDEATRDVVARSLGEAGLVVPVGSGVVSDLGKWVAWDEKLPLVTVPTAASMNGYASSNIAPTVDGLKTVRYTRPPEAILAVPGVLRGAPMEMTTSGLGDVLAKSVSTADWYLNHMLFGDYFCSRSAGLIAEVEPLYLQNPEGIRDGQPEALGGLFDALLLTGAAMSMAETSAPASGGEHLISHTLDILAMSSGAEHDLHGRQVGVGTVLCAELYRRLLALESPSWGNLDADIDERFWGPRLAGPVAKEYAAKQDRLKTARGKLTTGRTWDEVRSALALTLRTPDVLHGCLAAAGGATSAHDLGVTQQHLADVLTRARQMRQRFTVLDLAHLAGILPASAGEIIEQWA